MLSDVCLSDVCRVRHEYSWRPQLLEARRAGRRRRKACMSWYWAAACGVQGQIMRPRAQLVDSTELSLYLMYCLFCFRVYNAYVAVLLADRCTTC